MFFWLLMLVGQASFGSQITHETAADQAMIVTPTKKITQSLSFSDDMNWKNLELALTRQLKNFRDRPSLTRKLKYGEDVYTVADLKASTETFLKVLRTYLGCVRHGTSKAVCEANLNQSLNTQFSVYEPQPASTEPGFGTDKPTFFTAYYSPDLEGSYQRTAEHQNPIYKLPASEDLRKQTREKIDFEGALAGQGLELAWVKQDLFDMYLLHIQGGGRVRIQTSRGEKMHYLSYHGSNSQPFQFISKYMVEKGWITVDKRGIEEQEACIQAHPEATREIFSSNPSYVYFKFTETEPVGLENIPLTDGRSLATDIRIYQQVGVINFIQSQKPEKGLNGQPEMKSFSRFFISQDTGGAIRGNARADLYFGFGDEAAYVAYNTKVQGQQYFLIKRK
jgi:membrane-bound lytic murein transglycosylase A